MSRQVNYLLESLRSRVYELAVETPLQRAPILSDGLANHIWLKREDLQKTFSFKLRGAYNCIAHHVNLASPQNKLVVVTASAGNHAQGVAMAAAHLGLLAVIVMPVTTPKIKIDSVSRLGAKVILSGNDYDDAFEVAQKLVDKKKGAVLIHPYDDPWVICGQGTIALEIINQHPSNIESIFVPVGGGGLLAGICSCIKQIRPEIKIIGVEPEDACACYLSLEAGKRVKLDQVGMFADGVAVRSMGKLCFSLVKNYVDQVILVSDDEICNAIESLYVETRSIAEPSGALSIAGLWRYLQDNPSIRNKHFVGIVSGANINFNKLRYVSERVEYSTGEEKLLAITIPEKPGSFKKLSRVLSKYSITEFNYRHNGAEDAHIFCGVRMGDKDHLAHYRKLLSALKRKKYDVVDMTNNDLAKTHIRYTIGGRLSARVDERLFRMEFAERPGALLEFLESIPAEWNISLFHYRNHGSYTGQVLCAIQGERLTLKKFKSMGYTAIDETKNPAYMLFLH